LFTDGLSALGEHLVATGSYADAVDVYRRLVRADPWDEAAHRRLMSALVRAGQRGEALRQYDRLVALLEKELGSSPDRETVELYDQLRRADFGS
jgi:DNA-binding SARP family transcriptional activator